MRRLRMLSRRHWALKLILLPNIRPIFLLLSNGLRGAFLTYPIYHHGETIRYNHNLPPRYKGKGSQLTDSPEKKKTVEQQ